MPKRRTAARHRLRLALYSDQECAANRPMDERLLRLIGGARPRIGYVSSAPDVDRVEFDAKRAYYAALGAALPVYVDATMREPHHLRALLDCDAVHLSGGNTFEFSRWLQRAGLLEPLRRYARRDGVLVGVSAGAILMTPSIATAALCGDPADDPPDTYDALGLVGFRFWPHHAPGLAEAPWRQALLAANLPLFACPDGAGIVVEGDSVEHWGAVRLLDGA